MDLSIAGIGADAAILAGLALVLRALASLVTAWSSALTARAEALRETATAGRIAAETDLAETEERIAANTAAERRGTEERAALEGQVLGLQARLGEIEEDARRAHLEAEEAHRAHAQTLGRLEELELLAQSERERCDRALAALRDEMERRLDEITSGHLTPARRTP